MARIRPVFGSMAMQAPFLSLKGRFGGLLHVEIDRQVEIISGRRLNAPQGFDFSSHGVDLDLPAAIHPPEHVFPLILDPIFSDDRPHSIRGIFRLLQFVFVDLSDVADEMSCQIAIIVGPRGSDIDEETGKMNPVRFKEGKFLPIDIGFDLEGFEGSPPLWRVSAFAGIPPDSTSRSP